MVYQPKKQYSWWDGYARTVDANVVGAVVEHLEEENGKVTKEDFLDVSRPEDSPTHELFEWDDNKAAEAYRLDQSRHIINALRVVYTNKEDVETKVPAFIRTSPPKANPVYENIHSALQNEGKREIILNRLRGELDAFIIRNQHIEELADLLAEASEKARKRGKQ